MFREVTQCITRPADLCSEQVAAIEHRGGNVFLAGGAGTGKTQVIVERCRSLIAGGVSSDALLVLTSQRTSAELRSRLRQLDVDDSPIVRTFDGFATWILEHSGSAISRRILAAPAERAIFRRAAESASLISLPPDVAQSSPFLELAKAHVDELSRAPADARRLLSDQGTSRTRDLIELAAKRAELCERLDLGAETNPVARAVELAGDPGPNLVRSLLGRFEHILVDEFQDCDPLHLALLQLFDGEIFAAGDADRAIYSFRPAAVAALAKTQSVLSMTTMRLGLSFRCSPSAIALAQGSRGPSAPDASADDGTIVFRRAMSPRDEATLIGQSVAQAVAAGTPANDIAILLRDAQPMSRLLVRDLRARGIAVAEQGGRKVLDDPAVDVICAAFKAFAAPEQIVPWADFLTHPALEFSPLAIRLAAAEIQPQSVDAVCGLLELLDVKESKRGGQIAKALRAAYGYWEQHDVVSAARCFASRSGLASFDLDVAAGDALAGRPAVEHNRALDAFVHALADVCAVRMRMNDDTSARANFEALVEGSRSLRTATLLEAHESGVHILSVYAAKGREFAFVAIADAVDGRFPRAWRPDDVLASLDIESARACSVDIGTLADEHFALERALWSVAITRSKHRLLVTWSETGIDGSTQRAGRFIPLDARLHEAQRPSFRAPLEEVTVVLRDVQGASPAHLPRPVAVSTFETWLTCRRKFYYSALLRIGGSQRGFKAKLGTLVHRAIHEFHSVVHDFRAVEIGAHTGWSAHLRSTLTALLTSAEPPFETALEVAAATRAAHRLVDRYARELERTARERHGFEMVASEQRVDFTLSGVDFTGKIDRIDEYADGSLGIVDVKTAAFARNKEMADGFIKLGAAAENAGVWTNAPSRANPQLALYRHAIAPATLSFVYLDAPPKSDEHADAAYTDRLSCSEQQPALAAIDIALATTFVQPWTTGAIDSLEPTRFARTCRSCEFIAVCPGYLEDDEA